MHLTTQAIHYIKTHYLYNNLSQFTLAGLLCSSWLTEIALNTKDRYRHTRSMSIFIFQWTPQFCEPFIGHAGSEQCFQPSYGRELTYSGTCGSTHWKNYKHFQHTFYVGKQGCLCCLKSFQSWCAQGIVFWVKVVPPVFYFLLQSVGAGRSSRYHSTSSSSLSSVSLLELLVPGMLLASQANSFKE